VENGVLYLGDSATDNPAFEKADIAIGVLNSETHSNLTCKYFIKYEQLDSLLEYLIKNAICFNFTWHMILEKRKAEKAINESKNAINQ
jgi:hypothetical protein